MRNERSRRWQLTENNAEYTKQEAVKKLCGVAATIYCGGCCEVGESGTNHIHAFVIYENAISLTTLKKQFPRAHFEPCKGSNADNYAYIAKSDSEIVESGVMPLATASERKSNEASEVTEMLFQGETLLSIIHNRKDLADYCVRNYKSLREIENDVGHNFARRKR